MLRYPNKLDHARELARAGVGGFCVFGGDDRLPAFLEELQALAPYPLLIASDVEEGAGQQVAGQPRHPPAIMLDPDAAEAAGARTALDARPLGITMTFAPVCDVASLDLNPIIQERAFADPLACAPRYIEGARRYGLRACAKHFPGHGATDADSHDALPLVDADAATWRERDLPPFRAAIEAGVDAVMTAHIDCPALTGEPGRPATLSRAVVSGLLREELGFTGLVVTDALLMDGVLIGRSEAEAALLAIEAGCDMVICPARPDPVLAALREINAPAAVERVARAAEPLPDPIGQSLAKAVRAEGPLPAGPGPHPLRIVELSGDGDALAAAVPGLALERYDRHGKLRAERPGTGLDRPAAALVWRTRAWGGPLALPAEARPLLAGAELLILLGPPALLNDLDAPSRVVAAGEDTATLAEVCRRAFALNSRT
jgi:beta-glucosidase